MTNKMHDKLRRILTQLTILIGMGVMTTSCGELWSTDVQEYVDIDEIILDRHEITLMEGDTYQLGVSFVPDSVTSALVYWYTNDDEVASVYEGMVTAEKEGETSVVVISVDGALVDQCKVKVMQEWYFDNFSYPYDMVYYYDVMGEGVSLDDVRLAAYCGEELRGVSEIYEDSENELKYGILRMYSPNAEGDSIIVRAHNRAAAMMCDVDTLVFDIESHGRPGSPYVFEIK